jgi:flagellar basal body rod protein FlgB
MDVFGITTYAMRGLQRRSEAIADNIANMNTENHRATGVSFEEELRLAIVDERRAPAPESFERDTPVNQMGNTVQLDIEFTELTRTSLARQVVVNGFNSKMDIMKTAAGR